MGSGEVDTPSDGRARLTRVTREKFGLLNAVTTAYLYAYVVLNLAVNNVVRLEPSL